jgi:hypothetical protein
MSLLQAFLVNKTALKIVSVNMPFICQFMALLLTASIKGEKSKVIPLLSHIRVAETLSIKTFGITTFSIMTLSIMTFSKMTFNIRNKTRHSA